MYTTPAEVLQAGKGPPKIKPVPVGHQPKGKVVLGKAYLLGMPG